MTTWTSTARGREGAGRLMRVDRRLGRSGRRSFLALGARQRDRFPRRARSGRGAARMSGQAPEFGNVIGRRNSHFEQEGAGNAALAVGRLRRAASREPSSGSCRFDEVDAAAIAQAWRGYPSTVSASDGWSSGRARRSTASRSGRHSPLHQRVGVAVPYRYARPRPRCADAARTKSPHSRAGRGAP